MKKKYATMVKEHHAQFGQVLRKGERVQIKEDNGKLIAFRTNNSIFGFTVNEKDFKYE